MTTRSRSSGASPRAITASDHRQQLHGFEARARLDDLERLALHARCDQLAQHLIILDDEDAGSHRAGVGVGRRLVVERVFIEVTHVPRLSAPSASSS